MENNCSPSRTYAGFIPFEMSFIIDAADYTVWRDHYSESSSGASSSVVPEPSTAAMLVIGCVVVLVAVAADKSASQNRV